MAAVLQVLKEEGAAVAFLDQRSVLRTEFDLEVSGQLAGRLRVENDEIDLREIRAVYLRAYETIRIPAVQVAGRHSVEAEHALNTEDMLTSWLDITSAFVINRPTSMASNNSKPYQSSIIRAYGFAVPETLVTTDPRAALDFAAEHGGLIYKSISNTRSIVSCFDPKDTDRLNDVIWCPTQFQKFISGRDFRVHVIGDEVFSCAIYAHADDYRYTVRNSEPKLYAVELPTEVESKCRDLAWALDLPVAGIDLRRTPDSEWYCFEVNPAPGFTYFQRATDQPIDRAIAKLLIAAY